MTPVAPGAGAVGIVGAGRAGQGLALGLVRTGRSVRLYARRARPVPPELTLDVGPAERAPPWLRAVEIVILAVRDDALPAAVHTLAASGALGARHVALHLSGSQGTEALAELRPTGAALGSLHPLQTLVDPEAAPAALRGARAAIEGDPRAREAASALAEALGMVPLEVSSGRKALYHAAAVFASNYLVASAAVGERLLGRVGIPLEQAWPALRPLLEGTLRNLLAATTPADALTGPVIRGDEATVARHLDVLEGDDATLYRVLARATLAVAQARGLDPAVAGRLALRLGDDADPLRG